MHGRKRVGVPPPTAEALAATAKKVEQYKRLSAVVLHHRAQRTCTAQSLELASQLLAANPDVYTLWNYVREQVLALAGLPLPAGCAAGAGAASSAPVAALGEEAFAALVAAQLALTVAAIKRNPKSYPAWHHRRWLVESFRAGRGAAGAAAAAADAPAALIPLAGELALCAELLAKDERNFHCWNYRRWVASLDSGSGGSAEEAGALARELAFTDEKIAQNFSNYSAWHARTCLLQRQREATQDAGLVAAAAIAGARWAVCARVPFPRASVFFAHPFHSPRPTLHSAPAELTLARKAVFTEPDDQSAWFYRRWVVDCLVLLLDGGGSSGSGAGSSSGAAAGGGEAAAAAAEAALLEDVSALRELSLAEPACKWPLEARAYTILQLRRHGRGAGSGLEDEQALFTHLCALDPRHAAYYRHIAGVS